MLLDGEGNYLCIGSLLKAKRAVWGQKCKCGHRVKQGHVPVTLVVSAAMMLRQKDGRGESNSWMECLVRMIIAKSRQATPFAVGRRIYPPNRRPSRYVVFGY